MPDSNEILATLSQTAHQFFALAVVWHIVLGLGLVALSLGFSPSRKLALGICSVPLSSVSVLAWALDSPFNGAVFAVLAGFALYFANRTPAQPLPHAETWALLTGGVLVVFAWIYPHFLEDMSPLSYLYAAPVGLIPCPTLALVSGVTLLGGGFAGRLWSGVIAIAAAFYALFGLFRLGVALDLFLVLGPFGLLVQQVRLPGSRILTRG